ncbi:hypothetical protein QY95_02800 [Bacillus thermotolerans]|uniref:Uncharacterized protein n=1 Tax=Bacillus thermotolerans TaxID=1221996 RepID=A0A0F5HXC7_BACTR|nr:hypothetical protein QY95_02800 [Bacillus thermotolerans]
MQPLFFKKKQRLTFNHITNVHLSILSLYLVLLVQLKVQAFLLCHQYTALRCIKSTAFSKASRILSFCI